MAGKKSFRQNKIVTVAVILMLTAILGFDNSSGGYPTGGVDYKKPEKNVAAFEPVLPGKGVKFPGDFRFHPEYQQEKWHFFANTTDKNGLHYSIQWSYYRIAHDDRSTSGWLSPQLYISHVVVTSKDKIWTEQRLVRGGIGQGGLRSRPFRLWIDNWNWRSLGTTPLPGLLSIETDSFSVELSSMAVGPYVLNGEQGYRKKHDSSPLASYEFSAPFLRVSGRLVLDGELIQVKGAAWLSKEWGNGIINDGTRHQDKFVFRLDDGRSLELNRILLRHNSAYYYGTLSDSNGTTMDLQDQDVVVYPISYIRLGDGHQPPVRWLVSIPAHNIKLTVEPVRTEQWHSFVIPYWEGPIVAFGSHAAHGYMHLSGY